jgi:hypothetical protein
MIHARWNRIHTQALHSVIPCLKKSQKYNIQLEMLTFWHATSEWGNILLSSVVTAVHSALLGVLKRESTQQGLWLNTTHDNKYFKMLITLGTCNRWADTAAWEYILCYPGCCHSDANVFRQLKQLLFETGSVTPMVHMGAGHAWTVWIPAIEDAITTAVEWNAISHNWDCPNWGSSEYLW